NLNGLFYKNTQNANAELFNEIGSLRQEQRLLPFAIINPVYPGWENDFKKCVASGVRGIKLYPQYHDYELLDPACLELVKMARDEGLIIGLTMRMVDSRQRSWMDIDQVAGTAKGEWSLENLMPIIREVPDAKYFSLNVANSTQVNDSDTLLIKKGNILMDTSGRAISDITVFLDRFGSEKFAFGSHSPILDYLTGLLRIESLRVEEAGDDIKQMLRSGNAIQMLGSIQN